MAWPLYARLRVVLVLQGGGGERYVLEHVMKKDAGKLSEGVREPWAPRARVD